MGCQDAELQLRGNDEEAQDDSSSEILFVDTDVSLNVRSETGHRLMFNMIGWWNLVSAPMKVHEAVFSEEELPAERPSGFGCFISPKFSAAG